MKKLFLKSIFFFGLVTLILLSLDSFFIDYDNSSYHAHNTLYQAQPNSVAVVLIGNSHLTKGVDDYIIESKSGLHTISVSAPRLNIVELYFNLKEVLTHQQPKLVVIENWALISEGEFYNEPFSPFGRLRASHFKRRHFKRWGKVSFTETFLSSYEGDYYTFFNAISNHDFWKNPIEWKESVIKNKNNDSREFVWNKSTTRTVLSSANRDNFNTTVTKFNMVDMTLTSQERKYVLKIAGLSEQYNFELLFVTVPIYRAYYKQTKAGFEKVMQDTKTLLKDFKNVSVLDINGALGGLDETHIMNKNIVSNNQHLNYKGKIKTSVYLANYINATYNFKVKANNNKSFPEFILYSPEVLDSEGFIGEVVKLNGKRVNPMDTIKVGGKRKKISIQGWMKQKGCDTEVINKMVALKKDEDFIYFSKRSLKEPTNFPAGLDKKDSYTFSVDKKLLDRGNYQLYHLVQHCEGGISVKNTNVNILIEQP